MAKLIVGWVFKNNVSINIYKLVCTKCTVQQETGLPLFTNTDLKFVSNKNIYLRKLRFQKWILAILLHNK